MSAVGLARVSTLDQNPQLQLTALHEAGCDPIYEEKVSGKGGTARPIRDQVLRELTRGDTLTVWKLDRLGRSVMELGQIIKDLENRGIKFRSLTEKIDTSTPQGKAFFQLLAVFAELERKTLIERTLAGKAAAREAGKFPGGHRLFGFPDSAKGVTEAQAEREADLLREAAAHILAGGSLRQLVNAWNALRVPTKNGVGPWNETVIRRMLVNPRMVPILGKQTHQELTRLFAPAREHQRMGAPAVNVLSGILRCGRCGQPMYGSIEHGQSVYRCRREAGRNREGCGKVSIARARAEDQVSNELLTALSDPEFVARIKAWQAELLADEASVEEIQEWRDEIEDLETVLTTRYGTDEHKIRHDELQRRVRQATANLMQRPDLQTLLDLAKSKEKFQAKWADASIEQQRRVLKTVFNHVTVEPVGYRAGRRFQPDRIKPDWRI